MQSKNLKELNLPQEKGDIEKAGTGSIIIFLSNYPARDQNSRERMYRLFPKDNRS